MKIKLTYAPADHPIVSWEWDPDELDNLEAERIETVGGDVWDSYSQWWYLLTRGNTRAIRALLWILLRRGNPQMGFNEIRFLAKEVSLEDVAEPPAGKDEPAENDTDSPSAQPDSPPDLESSTDGQSQSSTQPVPG